MPSSDNLDHVFKKDFILLLLLLLLSSTGSPDPALADLELAV